MNFQFKSTKYITSAWKQKGKLTVCVFRVEKPVSCQHATDKWPFLFICGSSGLSAEVRHTPYWVRPIILQSVRLILKVDWKSLAWTQQGASNLCSATTDTTQTAQVPLGNSSMEAIRDGERGGLNVVRNQINEQKL